MKFTGLLPASAGPYVALAVGTVGPFLITMLPPVMATPFSDHVEHELARIFQVATFALGVLPAVLALNHAPAAANDWCAFASAAIAALGVVFLPKAQPKDGDGTGLIADEVTSKGPRAAGFARLPAMLALAMLSVWMAVPSLVGCATVGAIASQCGPALIRDVLAILLSGRPTIQSELDALPGQVADVACAVKASIGELEKPKVGRAISPAESAAIAEGKRWLAAKGIK